MNLLQSQDTLRGLSVGVLRAKSQGKEPPNPDAPLWLVNTVLAEKVAALEKEKLAQGAAKGALPSIAEQINQKAGLMALQGQQQQQTQQQMSQQMTQAPQPAPEGVPQPERQPQPEPPVMTAAEGGLARLPVDSRMFDYREGGIIGFAESEGAVPDPGANLDAIKEQAKQAIANLQRYGTNQQRQDPEGYKQALAAVENAKQAIQQAQTSYQASMSDSGMDKPYIAPQKPFRSSAPVQNQVADAYSQPRETSANVAQQGLRSLQNAPPDAPRPAPPAAPPRPRPPAQPPAVTSPAATPTAAPPVSPGLPSVAPPSDLQQLLMESLKKETPNRTVDQARDEYKAASPAILNEPAGLAQLARLKQQQDQYEEGKKSRPMENFMRGLASAARGGIGGFGDAYLTNSEGNRAADAAQADYQNKVMTAVDAMRRGEATTEQKGILEDLKEARKTKAEDDRSRRTNITTAADSESLRRTQLEVNRLNRESQEKIAELDRAMRQAHYLNPIAASTQEERYIKRLMDTGLSFTAAMSKLTEIKAEPKTTIAEGRITAAHAKLLAEDGMYVRAQQILLDPSKSASEKAKAQLTIDTKEKILGIPPKSSQPTMTPAQAAAMEKYGAK